ncbi:MAG: hypothetical protein Q9162_003039 [Coniocarpon cinnabarinum]
MPPLATTLRIEGTAFVGEFVGTFLFLFVAFLATQIANVTVASTGTASVPDVSALLFISLAFGFSLGVNAWVFFRITGGLFNPAVTLSLAFAGAIGPLRAGVIFLSQIIAGIASAAVVKGLLPGHPELMFKVSLASGMGIAQGLFLEMFVTIQLILTILFLAAEKHKATFIAPVGIGLALFISELASVFYTGGALNPARAFGPCVVDGDFPGYHWIYWLGPLFGSCVASAYYWFNKHMNYQEVNPGQDKNEDKETANSNEVATV